jgi:hypothetical protein
MKAEHVAEIQRLCELEANGQKVVMDLKEVTLVDRDAVMFLASCEVDGTKLTNCPPYIREWIVRERNGK